MQMKGELTSVLVAGAVAVVVSTIAVVPVLVTSSSSAGEVTASERM